MQRTLGVKRQQRYQQMVLGGLAIALAGLPLAQGAMAQSADGSLLPTNPQAGDGNTDPFSSRGASDSGSMLDLIHRATMGTIRTPEQFQRDQQGSIGSEAQTFRNRQLEMLRQQQQQTGSPQSSPQPNPSPTNE